MRTTFSIAKLELSTLFYSPVAWLVLIVFTFQAALQFTGLMQAFEAGQQLRAELSRMTEKIFTSPMTPGLFLDIQDKLYLYIPLLTMGLMSREISSGSIKLLLSSPIKISEIIGGKFIAIMGYGLLLICILGAFIAGGVFSIAALDVKFLLSGLLGLYLLLCAYSAIGLFMSCLTSYQVVAAISTLVALAALNYIGTLWQGVDFVRDLTYFLSISGRADMMIGGLISSKDVLYFIIIILFFLGCSILKLRSDRESVSGLVKAGRYAGLLCLVLIAGYVTSRPAMIGYYDMTVTKSRTLTPNSQEVIKKVTQPLTMTTYVNLLDGNAYMALPERRNVDMGQFEEYVRFMPNMKMKYIYYYDSSRNDWLYKNNPGLSEEALAQKVAVSERVNMDRFLPPAAIHKIIDLAPEENRLVRQLEAGNRKTFLRMFQDMMRYPSETEITAALKRLTNTPSKVTFLVGNNERSMDKAGDKDYKMSAIEITFRYALINQGFDVTTLDLSAQNISDSTTILVIADPKTIFNQSELGKIQRYIDRGGNLLIAGEPGKQEVLNPIIRPMGVRFMSGALVRKSADFAPDFIVTDLSPQAIHISGAYQKLIDKGLKIVMPGAAALQYEDTSLYRIDPVLLTDPINTWNTTTRLDQDSSSLTYSPERGDRKLSAPTVLSLTRRVNGKEQRIIIAGDADFMSNAELGRRKPASGNFAFSSGLFKWLSNGVFPVDTSRPDTKDTKLDLRYTGVVWLKVIFMGLIPLLLLVLSVILLIRRKRN